MGSVESPHVLADMLTTRTWTLCSAFTVAGREEYLFLNDATHEDGAGERAVVKKRADGKLWITAHVRNTSHIPGDEVAQLYLNFPDSPGVPQVALRGFERLSLAAGEHRTLTFNLSPRDLSTVNLDGDFV